MAITIHLSCPNHRRYSPYKDGEGGIRGGCTTCNALFQLMLKAEAIRRDLYEEDPTKWEGIID